MTEAGSTQQASKPGAHLLTKNTCLHLHKVSQLLIEWVHNFVAVWPGAFFSINKLSLLSHRISRVVCLAQPVVGSEGTRLEFGTTPQGCLFKLVSGLTGEATCTYLSGRMLMACPSGDAGGGCGQVLHHHELRQPRDHQPNWQQSGPCDPILACTCERHRVGECRKLFVVRTFTCSYLALLLSCAH
jgi:hypothetical protein